MKGLGASINQIAVVVGEYIEECVELKVKAHAEYEAKAAVKAELNRREDILRKWEESWAKAMVDLPPYRAGEAWTPDEDDQLADEVTEAVKRIAAKHQRNFGGIWSRIRRNEIFKY
jgi:hypothetical protein